MGIRIRNKKHYYTRLPWVLLGILIISISPFLIGILGSWISGLITGEAVNEGNSVWPVLPWFVLFTIPIGFILFIIYAILVLKDSRELYKKPPVS